MMLISLSIELRYTFLTQFVLQVGRISSVDTLNVTPDDTVKIGHYLTIGFLSTHPVSVHQETAPVFKLSVVSVDEGNSGHFRSI